MSDLPSPLAQHGPGEPYVELLEAIGTSQDERVMSHINLCAVDTHGDQTSLLQKRAGGMPQRTCERWVRLRVVPPSAAISGLSVWLADYDPSPGWSLLLGSSDTYRKPAQTISNIATVDPPITAPGLPLAITYNRYGWTSDWLVAQVTWSPGEVSSAEHTYALQPVPVHFAFSWMED